jgi:hypothetical protein
MTVATITPSILIENERSKEKKKTGFFLGYKTIRISPLPYILTVITNIMQRDKAILHRQGYSKELFSNSCQP